MTAKHPSCRAIEPELPVVAAGEAGAAVEARVTHHVERCRRCRDELGQYHALERLVGTVREAPLPGDDPTVARARLEARLADIRSRVVAYGVFRSPFGPILIGRSELGVSVVSWLDRDDPSAAQIRRRLGPDAVENREAVEELYGQLREYFEGRRMRLDWPLDLQRARSPFQRRVLQTTARLPWGAVATYGGIARELGQPEAVRAVAQALRHNPVPIVVPCHRVIGSTGALVGYAGDRVDLKQRLLAVEGVPARRARRDYVVPRDRVYLKVPEDPEYCLPTCGSLSRRPLRELMLFGTREGAEAAGYAPCTTCRPDIHPLPR